MTDSFQKVSKNCCIRMTEDLHRQAKLQAYLEGKNLQKWVADLITLTLKAKSLSRRWVCQECGKWDIKGTQMAMLRDCGKCGKKEVATFPCEGM